MEHWAGTGTCGPVCGARERSDPRCLKLLGVKFKTVEFPSRRRGRFCRRVHLKLRVAKYLGDPASGCPKKRDALVRARADWKDVAKWDRLTVSPFVSLSHTDSHLDAYTETGGGFPARISLWRTP